MNDSSSVAWQKFILLKTKKTNDLFCFYEGKDGPYYFNRIQNNYGEHHPITCGRKSNVLKLHEKFTTQYNNSIKASFFVDSDFDEKHNKDFLYETPCYSVENFYTSKKVLVAILKNEFLLTEEDEEFHNVISEFESNQKDFHNATLLLNSWYACIKRKSNSIGESANASLSEQPPKDFIIIKIGEISSNYDFNKIKERFPESFQITEEEVIETQKEFELVEKNKYFRGKYEVEFIYKFLLHLIEDANVNKRLLKKKTNFKIERAQILSQLSQYAETPPCLIKHISNYK